MAMEELTKIAEEIRRCRRCPLYRQASQAVPGEGKAEAKVVFIGEAPGYWEDQKGIPFCGAAGRLLDRLMAEGGLKRSEVFITNILKHRPPNNRDPQPAEIRACTPFLERQLLVIKPKLVVTLGRFALNYFLPEEFISRVHGRLRRVSWRGMTVFVLPLYHPAAALRNGRVMTELKNDFLKIKPSLEWIERQEKEEGVEGEEEKKEKKEKVEQLSLNSKF